MKIFLIVCLVILIINILATISDKIMSDSLEEAYEGFDWKDE